MPEYALSVVLLVGLAVVVITPLAFLLQAWWRVGLRWLSVVVIVSFVLSFIGLMFSQPSEADHQLARALGVLFAWGLLIYAALLLNALVQSLVKSEVKKAR